MAEIRGCKVVFEGEGWSIIEAKPELSDGTRSLIASHEACPTEDEDSMEDGDGSGEGGVMSWFRNEEDAICYYCGASVPAEIQALIHLACSF